MKMRKTLLSLSLILVFSLILTACATAATPTPAPAQDVGQVATMVAKTVDAIEAQKAAQATTPPQIPTLPQLPDQQPTTAPVGVPTLALPSGSTTVPCNQAISISETYQDYTVLAVNTPFTKSWTIQNAGTCTWNTSYKLVFVSGDQMSGPKSINFPTVVPPGANVALDLSLTANSAVGTTTGYWGLYNDKNVYWGRVWVTIVTGVATAVPKAFLVTLDHYEIVLIGAGPDCNFIAYVNATKAGTATFKWTYTHLVLGVSTTEDSPVSSTDFASAGQVRLGFTLAGTTKAYLNNIYPNNQSYLPPINCP
jgi:hypothetical protein